jgi:hypothetical protein
MIYRVMYDTNAMQADTDYFEMAQLLGDAALPGEAQMILEKPMSTYVYLGRDSIARNKPADAKKAFEQLSTVPNISPRVLRLWNLYADTLPEAPSASL